MVGWPFNKEGRSSSALGDPAISTNIGVARSTAMLNATGTHNFTLNVSAPDHSGRKKGIISGVRFFLQQTYAGVCGVYRRLRSWSSTCFPSETRAKARVLLLFCLMIDLTYVLIATILYNAVRKVFGSGRSEHTVALRNALYVVRLEQRLSIYWEETIQLSVLLHKNTIIFWNTFYIFGMFPIVFSVLAYVFIKHAEVYPRHRNTFLVMNVLALVGYAAVPLMPPRLLTTCDTAFGACQTGYKFYDTVRWFPNLLQKNTLEVIPNTNHYAAMPSMHVGYAYWTMHTLWNVLSKPVAKLLAIAYPIAMTYCTVVTGNHFFLDAVAGVATFHLAARLYWILPAVGQGKLFTMREHTNTRKSNVYQRLPVTSVGPVT